MLRSFVVGLKFLFICFYEVTLFFSERDSLADSCRWTLRLPVSPPLFLLAPSRSKGVAATSRERGMHSAFRPNNSARSLIRRGAARTAGCGGPGTHRPSRALIKSDRREPRPRHAWARPAANTRPRAPSLPCTLPRGRPGGGLSALWRAASPAAPPTSSSSAVPALRVREGASAASGPPAASGPAASTSRRALQFNPGPASLGHLHPRSPCRKGRGALPERRQLLCERAGLAWPRPQRLAHAGGAGSSDPVAFRRRRRHCRCIKTLLSQLGKL